MPLEHFKTQILLLHSEQRTLDALSAGFSDSYAVHCATSGTEALNIFGDTPIHVIVSAQNLPGMSGVDALREAKKRSPETIAILLAGNDAGDGLEALVGDQEVFQIVRGEVTPEALENLIDSATKSVRLLALSEASNDTAANVDEPHDDSEHIVMETAENGSFIISDGTGSVPVLKPGQVQIAPNAGGQTVDVLVLTQDEEFLATVRESSRGLHNVHHVVTPKQAEEATRQHRIGVLVTDAAMIGSNIEALTQGLRANVPRLVAIVAGRRDDGELLMDLINRGQVYRFLLKPVSPGRARLAIEASVKRHLEAPDAAFKGKPGAPPKAKKPAKPQKPVKAATPARRPNAPQSPQAPQAPQAPARSVRPAAQPAAAKPQQPPAARRQTRQEPRIGPTPVGTPPASISTSATGAHRVLPDQLNAGLDDAFDEAPSFTETVAGLAVSVGKSLTSAADSVKSKGSPSPAVATQTERSGLAKHGKVIGIGIAAVAVVVFALSYFSGDETEAPAPTPETVVDVEPQPQAPAEPVVQEIAPPAPTSGLFNTALEQARDARAIGNVYIPAGQNAVEYYLAALDLEPASTQAREELDQVLADVFNIAERALLENRSTDAGQALRVIFLADPENPRLAFLNAQLAQQEFRQTVVDTRNAIREARFEDAANLLAEAQIMSGADSAEIDALNGELADARSQQRLDDVLQAGAARLNADQLIAPANDNARYYYQLALNSEPGNAAAQQGLITIANKLVLRARVAIDEGNYAVAESLLSEARSLDPNSAELAASLSALQNQRDADAQAAAEAERQEAERQAAAAREAEAARLAAERAAQEQRAAEAQAQAAVEAEPANSAPESRPEVAAPVAPEPRPDVAAATADSATGAESESGTDAAAAFVSISTLERTKYVAPRYPRSAQRRNTSGYVDVAFTVNELGSVEGVEVTDSRPGELFDDAATNAVEQWEFSPIIENGSAVPKRVAIRLSFALE